MALNFSNYRIDELRYKMDLMNIRPLDIMATGVTGAGKSTTMNALFQKTIAKVGNGVDPETMEVSDYRLSDLLRIWDTPGLGDGAARDREHKQKMVDLLYSSYQKNGRTYGYIDMALVIIDGACRDMGTAYTLLNEVLVPNIQKSRILVAINRADAAMSYRHWDNEKNQPDERLLDFLEEKANSVKKRVYEATGVNITKPVCYSAKNNWNLDAVLDLIIDHIPKKRRKLINSQ